MGTVKKPGFYGGRFHQGGQGTEAETITDEVEADAVDLDTKSRDELVALAGQRGVTVKAADTKADIVAAINGAS
ncbi:hypothetical protein [Aureimonas phyllosphaerae]|uniref:Rho termination factor, N-terminal domain n=1 Tax=Aureimonas phyllosphaerae TaxID=1166078 RepID=A0A7W6BXJ8_9HYPH|nr:hypothetical protein [Aureimonas phyllosphaerae]MBB3937929.1 hypothetical protein [Aureimonas phyllosphaerae]MBB3961898.1 hypothetical protein [Aureimonas phyllosphaerae]SFF54532.1 hypothetical protein SAMN05216566_12526 [Aureimonas phyllosphaerae]